MLKLLKRVSVLFFLVVFIKQVMNSFAPYYWGNQWFASKVEFLQGNNELQPNVLFFGSSRVYRQITPEVFDREVNMITQKKISSFNLGAPATFSPQSQYLYRNYLKSDLSKDVKYAFFELTTITNTAPKLLHQKRSYYWLNLSDMKLITKSYLNRDSLSLEQKLYGISGYSKSYFDKIFRKDYFGSKLLGKYQLNSVYLGPRLDGFYSLEDELEKVEDSTIRRNLINNHNSVIQDSTLLKARANRSMFLRNSGEYYDADLLSELNKLIGTSKQRGIHLIFLILPRYGSKGLYQLADQIPSAHIIDLSSSVKYPEFYELEYSFDVGHLNDKGAQLLTKKLVEEFLLKSNLNFE